MQTLNRLFLLKKNKNKHRVYFKNKNKHRVYFWPAFTALKLNELLRFKSANRYNIEWK